MADMTTGKPDTADAPQSPKSGMIGALKSWPLDRIALVAGPILLCSLLGQLATFPQIPTWYAGLVKPSFNPPNWVFGPVWTTLFIMMGYAAYRILSMPAGKPGRTAALALFYVQLAVNASWSFAFFAAQSPLLGLIVIVPFLGLIVATIIAFQRLDRVAGWLLWPYAAWVSYATLLNVAIWRLNG
jgi:tryptophan-rich sensory protein